MHLIDSWTGVYTSKKVGWSGNKCLSLILLAFFILSLTVALPAAASTCRKSADRTICILSIQRSAKYYWEYRASVRIDGVTRPIEVYNCRDRLRVKKDGIAVPFQANGAGELICSFFQK